MRMTTISRRHALASLVSACLIGTPALAATSTTQAPQKLQIPTLSYDDHSVMLVWDAPEDTSNITDYQIYQNGQLIGLASQNNDKNSPAKPYISAFYKSDTANFHHRIVPQNAKVDGLKAVTDYQFTVRAVYADGSTSTDSNTVTATTTAVPKVINITQYGAKGDGTTLNTSAIQKAIDACPTGCRIDIPAGVFKTGALWLKSDMTLNLLQGATLLGSDNAADYPDAYKIYSYVSQVRPASLLNAIDKNSSAVGTFKNIRIVGKGIIDGNGWKRSADTKDELGNTLPQYVKSDNSKVSKDGILAKNQVAAAVATGMDTKTAYSQRRSSLVTLRGVQNAYIADVTIRNPANHGIMFLESENVVENGVIHQTFNANNGDGVEFGNSQNIMVFNSVFDTGDDSINFAAGMGQDAQKQEPSQNAWLFNNFFRHGHGAVVLGSHTGAGIVDVLAENNVITQNDIGLRAKSAPAIGGGAHGIVFRNSAMKNLAKQAVIVTLSYADNNGTIDYTPAKVPARFYDFTVKNVTVQDSTGSSPAIEITGDSSKDIWHSQFIFSNMKLSGVSPTSISDLSDSQFNNLTFSNLRSGSSPWKFGTVKNVTVDGKIVTP
ncbi:glycosyl hydrolase family 28 protein [Dickeya dianthicola]|uniref:glycosyl hydrolase family 28 protein n=1 Tax=Dickeya dianthicola TaxID=204039 RepID=UPI000CD3B203|nr:glycoside hydrolase family 28 protein [Dickeya dianthicola]MBI0439363.1 glycoside hydrolase family 28 protein [Dickeya dianthicola]MBI0451189.1 glycoside hydrolase family 28 protein [Dickeya dianthicola]MBI0454225.1 glycoside hydrolase family 28 protein [Dickeya dianthicola]MBI0459260.1 glycoside hydrolase family 28 protein [Dickeya dianthicola]MBI0464364.1 glycoside hydrolase family 28 protein [Dickeya dianthicola]